MAGSVRKGRAAARRSSRKIEVQLGDTPEAVGGVEGVEGLGGVALQNPPKDEKKGEETNNLLTPRKGEVEEREGEIMVEAPTKGVPIQLGDEEEEGGETVIGKVAGGGNQRKGSTPIPTKAGAKTILFPIVEPKIKAKRVNDDLEWSGWMKKNKKTKKIEKVTMREARGRGYYDGTRNDKRPKKTYAEVVLECAREGRSINTDVLNLDDCLISCSEGEESDKEGMSDEGEGGVGDRVMTPKQRVIKPFDAVGVMMTLLKPKEMMPNKADLLEARLYAEGGDHEKFEKDGRRWYRTMISPGFPEDEPFFGLRDKSMVGKIVIAWRQTSAIRQKELKELEKKQEIMKKEEEIAKWRAMEKALEEEEEEEEEIPEPNDEVMDYDDQEEKMEQRMSEGKPAGGRQKTKNLVPKKEKKDEKEREEWGSGGTEKEVEAWPTHDNGRENEEDAWARVSEKAKAVKEKYQPIYDNRRDDIRNDRRDDRRDDRRNDRKDERREDRRDWRKDDYRNDYRERQQLGETWKCECGFDNFMSRSVCKVCQLPCKLTDRPKNWACECGYTNFSGRTRCRICGLRKGETNMKDSKEGNKTEGEVVKIVKPVESEATFSMDSLNCRPVEIDPKVEAEENKLTREWLEKRPEGTMEWEPNETHLTLNLMFNTGVDIAQLAAEIQVIIEGGTLPESGRWEVFKLVEKEIMTKGLLKALAPIFAKQWVDQREALEERRRNILDIIAVMAKEEGKRPEEKAVKRSSPAYSDEDAPRPDSPKTRRRTMGIDERRRRRDDRHHHHHDSEYEDSDDESEDEYRREKEEKRRRRRKYNRKLDEKSKRDRDIKERKKEERERTIGQYDALEKGARNKVFVDRKHFERWTLSVLKRGGADEMTVLREVQALRMKMPVSGSRDRDFWESKLNKYRDQLDESSGISDESELEITSEEEGGKGGGSTGRKNSKRDTSNGGQKAITYRKVCNTPEARFAVWGSPNSGREEDLMPGKDGKLSRGKFCPFDNRFGHDAANCPWNMTDEEREKAQKGYTMNKDEQRGLLDIINKVRRENPLLYKNTK